MGEPKIVEITYAIYYLISLFNLSSMGRTTVSGFLLWFLINLLWYRCGIN